MDLNNLSDETLSLIKAQTSGIDTSTGIFGVDLTGLVSLVPVVTPFRNMLPREASPEGSNITQWRSLQNINNQQPSPAVAADFAGSLVEVDMLNVSAAYKILSMAGRVTQDSIDFGKSYADVLAVETLNTLNQLMIGEDKQLIGGCAYNLGTVSAPTVTASGTGGTIGNAVVVNVKVAARAGDGYFYGPDFSTAVSATGTDTTGAGSTNSATATVAAVEGAVCYDWFVNTKYYTTTVTNDVTITAIPLVDAAVPTNLPGLSGTAPVGPGPATDTSGNPDAFNGVIASTLGDYLNGGISTPGSGQASGSYWSSNDGSALTANGQGIEELDRINQAIWNSVNLSPTAYMCNSREAAKITTLLLESNQAFTMLPASNAAERGDLAVGGYATTYVNKAAGGARVRVEVHPNLPPGTIVARTDKVPFPGANISNVWSVRTLRDYSQFNYGANRVEAVSGGGPRTDFEIRSVETLVNRAPSAQAVISNIGE